MLIGVVTTSRADYGIYRPVLQRLSTTEGLSVELYVTGMHLAPGFGNSVSDIRRDGFVIAAELEGLVAGDTASATAKSLGLTVQAFGQFFQTHRPDLLLVLGDRFEMFGAAVASIPFNLPLAHIHGGEITQGAIDDSFRHALTKCSHLHFVTTTDHARRVVQMGEEPWRVCVSGAPSLDALATLKLLSAPELSASLGFEVQDAPLLVTFHPVTRDPGQQLAQVTEVVAALRGCDRQIIVTQVNADPGHDAIRQAFEDFARSRPGVHLVANLGTQRYFSLMALAGAMVGNSSSGLIEAPSFRLPVVNIGDRQAGRLRAANVVDAATGRDAIGAALTTALSAEFRATLAGLVNPYGTGCAAERIAARLSQPLDRDRLLRKCFHDLSFPLPTEVDQ